MTWSLDGAFDRAAPTYDAMVALSPGYHDQLRDSARALVDALPVGPARVLDLGCGSGASTAAVRAQWAAAGRVPGELTLTGVDASAGMIEQARRKARLDGIPFVHADAVAWLREQPAASVDGILAAYLLRNVPDRAALVGEMARVLRPGGALVVHDYSVAGNPRARAIWAAVCHVIIIPLAAVMRSDVPLHRYVYTSVRDFDSVQQICDRLFGAGFEQVQHRTVPGWQRGIVHTVRAVRAVQAVQAVQAVPARREEAA